jgi:hypothetical protein
MGLRLAVGSCNWNTINVDFSGQAKWVECMFLSQLNKTRSALEPHISSILPLSYSIRYIFNSNSLWAVSEFPQPAIDGMAARQEANDGLSSYPHL